MNKKSSKELLTTQQNDNEQVLASSSNIYINYYYSLHIINNNTNEWLRDINYSALRKYYTNWINILFKPDYLKIIYYLLQNEFCHVKGLVKVFRENANTCVYRLNNLFKYYIVEIVNDKKKYENVLYKHRHAFRIDDWHFEKAEWYKLTELGKIFYGKLDYSLSLDSIVIECVNNWNKHLSRTTREIEVEIKQHDKNLDDLFYKYKHLRKLRPDLDPIIWAKDKIKRGFIRNISPDSLVSKLEKRLHAGDGNE